MINSGAMKPEDRLKSGTRIGSYEVLSLVGAGGMGEVYRARDTRLKRDVALKVLRIRPSGEEDSVSRFEREARVVAALSHPNIVTLHDFGRDGEIIYAVMELLEGATLRTKLNEGPLSWEEAAQYGIQIARGLASAHEKGIIHRDLKPENLILSTDGYLKILDFGLARYYEEELRPDPEVASTHLLTKEGMLLGTFPYMSPEQIQSRQIDSRSDLFSLGVILYEMITGERPFQAESLPALFSAILRDQPKPMHATQRAVPAEMERIIFRCLQKDPSQRYQNARDVREALESIQRKENSSLTTDRSIAVLPFSDMSPEKDQDYFCEGMAEEIINALVRLPELKVASRVSSFQFKNQNLDVREIGGKLDVNTVLEGSVRKSGERLRITAQLINVADGYRLWSEKYDRRLDDVFQIQEEIAEAIVKALSVTLAPVQEKALRKQRAAIEAYDCYLRGKTFANKETHRDLKFAVEMFERAIQIDGSYVPAYAGLAIASSHLYSFWERTPQNLARAEEISERALQINPSSPDAQMARGYALSLQARHEEAELHFQTALQLDPRNFDACYYYARSLWLSGKLEESLEIFRKAAEVRPEDYRVHSLPISICKLLGKTEEARAYAQKTVEVVNRWISLNPDDARAYYMGAGSYAMLGNRERALEWSARALASAPDDPAHLYNVGCMYAMLGENALAMDMLEKAVQHGYASRDWMENDGDFSAFRNDPRFRRILDSITPPDTKPTS